jgi:hypothetical protein
MPAVGPFTTPPEEPKSAKAKGLLREVIGGDKRAAVRRIILWVLAILLLVSGAELWIVMLPLMLLMATDSLL